MIAVIVANMKKHISGAHVDDINEVKYESSAADETEPAIMVAVYFVTQPPITQSYGRIRTGTRVDSLPSHPHFLFKEPNASMGLSLVFLPIAISVTIKAKPKVTASIR